MKKKPLHKMADSEYLRDLAERLRHIPVMYGTDGYDIDRLEQIAKRLVTRKLPKEQQHWDLG